MKGLIEINKKNFLHLQEFYVDRNSLTVVPSHSLNGPSALRHLSLRHNYISKKITLNLFEEIKDFFNFSAILRYESFIAQPQLEIIDLRYNDIKNIEGLAFKGLRKIKEIKLARNRITNLNSDVFENLPTLQKLDLSENFIPKFPIVSLNAISNLKALNLSSNMLQVRSS